MILMLLSLAAVQTAEAPAEPEPPIRKERFVTSSRVPIPPEIFAEIRPYLDCMNTHMNSQLRAMGGATEEEFPQVRKVVLDTCQSTRVSAKTAAVKGLGGTQVRRRDRPDYVERALNALEDQMLSPPSPEGLPK
jgi:hypothetical protein